MDRALEALIRISRTVGEDSSLVQGGGGNTSTKTADGRHMYIKASGTALKDMGPREGWLRLRLDPVLAILDDRSLAALPPREREAGVIARLKLACEDDLPGDARPSVESHLHALLGRCVVHLHPVAVSALVCAKNGRAQVERLFSGEEPPVLWVPYADPGYKLALSIRRLICRYQSRCGRPPAILLLEKHGLLVAADRPNRALALVRRAVAICAPRAARPRAASAKPPPPDRVADLKVAIRRAHFEAAGERVAVKHFRGGEIAAFLARRDAEALLSTPALTPDEFAYANGPPLWLEDRDARAIGRKLKRRIARDGRAPTSFLAPGLGLFVVGAEKTIGLVREVVVASLSARAGTAAFGGPNGLNRRQREFIANWEMESYRKQVAGGTEGGDLAGRIAVITGAGSGLGRSISAGLARAGAMVALVDVDLPSAEETARLIAAESPNACSSPVRCDVTRESAVERAFSAVLDRWGGLDILVNAAGIAPPYPLVELPLDQWRRALEVNLTGYFLMARAAARILIRQAMGGSIINLSSKSGLEASKSNTPYNATKAAEIHLARGWALELGEHGIRVNSVAPGNVFEGSKIWSRDYIEACADKHGIEPEEVIPYYVNMTALKRKITGQDVADAVVFLCSDRARTITGQTLVPDGGQAMVR